MSRSGILGAVWRRRWLFCTVFALVAALTVVVLRVLPVRYVATGSVIVAEQEPAGPETPPAVAQRLGDPADLESQILLIRSPRVQRLALASPGIAAALRRDCLAEARGLLGDLRLAEPASSCDRLGTDTDAALAYVQPRFAVAAAGRSRVIDISYRSPLPEVAKAMADALVAAFLADGRATQSEDREGAAGWLWKEVAALDAALKAEEDKIQAFRRANGLMKGSIAPLTAERLSTAAQQLSAAEAARSEAAARLAEITAGRGGGSGSAPAVLASRSVADLKQQLTLASSQLANAAMALGPNHPTIQALRQQRDVLQAEMAREVASVAASARQILDADTAQVASLRRKADELKADAAAAAAAEASLDGMTRDVEVKRGQYADLYRRASELETQRRILAGTTRLVSLAELPLKPAFPKPLPVLAAGLTLAAVLAAAAAALRDGADRSVKGARGLTRIADVPILTRLPEVRRPGRGFLGLRFGEAPLSLLLEAARRDPRLQDGLRGLFARLAMANASQRCASILVTSTLPEEGKTLTTLALGSLVAATGRRVLVVEGDMRRPVFERVLGLEPSPGLNAVLRGLIEPRDAVVSTAIPNLDAVPGGRAVANSTELLLGRHMGELMKWAAVYDLVLIDSPPAGLLMDACVLARQVDWVLCCARWGRSQVDATEATLRGLAAAGGGAIGMVVTMTEPDATPLYDLRPAPARAAIGTEAAW